MHVSTCITHIHTLTPLVHTNMYKHTHLQCDAWNNVSHCVLFLSTSLLCALSRSLLRGLPLPPSSLLDAFKV